MELRSRTIQQNASAKRSGWSHEIIRALFEAGRKHRDSSDKWFIVPHPLTHTKDPTIEDEYLHFFITSLIGNEVEKGEFTQDLYLGKMGKKSPYDYIKEAMTIHERNIKEFGENRYVLLNFCPEPKKTAQKNFMKKHLLRDGWPPEWAVTAISQALGHDISTSTERPNLISNDDGNLTHSSSLSLDIGDEGYNDNFMNASVLISPEKPEYSKDGHHDSSNISNSFTSNSESSFQLQEEEETDQNHLNISVVSPEKSESKNNHDYISLANRQDNHVSLLLNLKANAVLLNSCHSISRIPEKDTTAESTLIDDSPGRTERRLKDRDIKFEEFVMNSIDIQTTMIDPVDNDVFLSSLERRYISNPSILNQLSDDLYEGMVKSDAFKRWLEVSTTAQSAIINSVTDENLLRNLKMRLKQKDDLLGFLDSKVVLQELIRRAKIEAPTFVANQLSDGRFRFMQSPEEMQRYRYNKFNNMFMTLTAACLQLLLPSNTSDQIYERLKILQNPQTEYYDFCKDMLQKLKDLRPMARRPQLAYFTASFTKSQVANLMGSRISKYEWRSAHMHAKFPGAGYPALKTIHRRCRVSNEAIISLEEAFTEDNLQRCAFGTKSVCLPEGKMEQFASVMTNKKCSTIVKQYIQMQQENFRKSLLRFIEVLDDEGEEHHSLLCPIQHKNGLHCILESGHSGKCKYTSKESLSESTFRRIYNLCTSGHITSLAGLDNEDVEKGGDNFERLRVMTSKLCQLTNTDKTPIIYLIDEAEVFHLCDFISHIKAASSNDEDLLHKCKCCCIKCGFNTTLDEIECPRKTLHQGVCSRCEKAFSIFPKLNSLVDLLRQQNDLLEEPSMTIKDEIENFSHHFKICRQNLIDYRAHLVLKFDEKEADKDELLNLKPHQAIVVCDWKMKILQAFHRETQQAFFGKRGTSMIGFMVISYPADAGIGSNVKDVNFHFMLTDDTTQDSVSVNAAKMLLYSQCLPQHVTEVRFRADGAGCFSSGLSKGLMSYWKKWTGIKEISNRQSPAGGGKTNLDGQFGVFSRQLRDRVDEGHNICDSDSIFKLMEDTSRLKATSYYIYSPERETVLNLTYKGLNQYYSISASEDDDDDDDKLILRKHSRHGKGKSIFKKEIHDSISVSYDGEPDDQKLADGQDPPEPRCTLYRSTQSNGVNILRGNGETSYLEKKERDLSDKVSRNNGKLENQIAQLLDKKTAAGLFPCCARNDQSQICKSVFQKKKCLEEHVAKNKHKFPKSTSITKAFQHVVNEKGVLACTNNRSTAVPKGDFGLELVLENQMEEHDWFQDGCYNKPKRKPATRMTQALRADLMALFEDGQLTGVKYTPETAYRILANMKNPDGRCKYSHHPENPNGPLPEPGRIKNFFNTESQKRKHPSTGGNEVESTGYNTMKNHALQEELARRNLPNKPNSQLFLRILLCLHDEVVNLNEEPKDDEGSEEDEVYETLSVKKLKEKIELRELDIKTPKSQLITMLILSDALIEDDDDS